MPPIDRLRRQREELITESRAILDAADAEGRDLTADDQERLDRAEEQITELDGRLERQQRLEQAMAASHSSDEDRRPGLAPEQRFADHVAARGGRSFGGGGLGASEANELSIGRLVRGMVTGRWDQADLERRALAEGVDSAGGFLTPEVLGATVIDRVRKRARVIEAGARVIPLDSDVQHFPRLAGGVTGAWKAENAPVAESDPVFERITFRAKTLAVLVKLSYELFDDLSDEGAAAIENELVQALGLEVDRAALRGAGTGGLEPVGVRNQAGVLLQSLGANGATPSYAALVDAVAEIQAKNFDPNAAIYSARTAKTLSTLADSTGQPLGKPPLIEELRTLVSNQVPQNLSQGTSNDTSEIYTAQWDQLLLGVRPVVRIEATRTRQGQSQFPVNVKASSERFIDTMSVGLLAWVRADVALAHPEAFVVTTGVRP